MMNEKGMTGTAKDIKSFTKELNELGVFDNLSLCSNCNCMTHTINDKCGKCNFDKGETSSSCKNCAQQLEQDINLVLKQHGENNVLINEKDNIIEQQNIQFNHLMTAFNKLEKECQKLRTPEQNRRASETNNVSHILQQAQKVINSQKRSKSL
jgi:hypothetical protein